MAYEGIIIDYKCIIENFGYYKNNAERRSNVLIKGRINEFVQSIIEEMATYGFITETYAKILTLKYTSIMGLAVKLGNPFIKTRTRSEDVEAFNRIHAAYAEIRQSDNTYDVVIGWDCMIIRAGGRRPKKVKYTLKANVDWIVEKMYGEASVAVQKNRLARFSQDATDKLKSLTNLIKEGAYVYVDTEDDSILIVLGDKKVSCLTTLRFAV